MTPQNDYLLPIVHHTDGVLEGKKINLLGFVACFTGINIFTTCGFAVIFVSMGNQSVRSSDRPSPYSPLSLTQSRAEDISQIHGSLVPALSESLKWPDHILFLFVLFFCCIGGTEFHSQNSVVFMFYFLLT